MGRGAGVQTPSLGSVTRGEEPGNSELRVSIPGYRQPTIDDTQTTDQEPTSDRRAVVSRGMHYAASGDTSAI